MYESSVRNLVAVIVIFGHLLVFGIGLSLGIFRVLVGTDAIQILLMASPVLATTALAALTHILATGTDRRRGKKTIFIFSLFAISIPTILIFVILGLFFAFYAQIDGFGSTELKIAVGAVETTFGAFLGAVSTRLFPGVS